MYNHYTLHDLQNFQNSKTNKIKTYSCVRAYVDCFEKIPYSRLGFTGTESVHSHNKVNDSRFGNTL